MLRVHEGGLEYIPESTGIARPDTWQRIEKVLDRFNETGSLKPGDYHDITHHSSYVLATLKHLFPTIDPAADRIAADAAESLLRDESASAPVAAKPHQRVGSVSNAHVGADFERVALAYFAAQGIELRRNYPVEVGHRTKKVRHFDLGSADARVLVECKSHRWTEGAKVPSAKMTGWNEAMYYFHLAPTDYRKVLFVLHDRREKAGESLLSYYTRMYGHLIPADVEILEWDEVTGNIITA